MTVKIPSKINSQGGLDGTDEQVRRLMKFIQKDKSFGIAAAKAGMDEKTARKYHILGKLPSDIQAEHNWRTREDTFSEVWDKVRSHLEINSGLEAKTLFEDPHCLT